MQAVCFPNLPPEAPGSLLSLLGGVGSGFARFPGWSGGRTFDSLVARSSRRQWTRYADLWSLATKLESPEKCQETKMEGPSAWSWNSLLEAPIFPPGKEGSTPVLSSLPSSSSLDLQRIVQSCIVLWSTLDYPRSAHFHSTASASQVENSHRRHNRSLLVTSKPTNSFVSLQASSMRASQLTTLVALLTVSFSVSATSLEKRGDSANLKLRHRAMVERGRGGYGGGYGGEHGGGDHRGNNGGQGDWCPSNFEVSACPPCLACLPVIFRPFTQKIN